jgi:tight adherence protein C
MQAPQGPTLLGVDVLWVATILSGIAAFSVIIAIYAATTVRDPMAKRVKNLNERREQLKAGIVASTGKRRASLTKTNETTDKMRSILGSLQMLQEDQLKEAQIKLQQAGIRSKDMAVAVLFGRVVAPIVLGGLMAFAIFGAGLFADWTGSSKAMAIGVVFIISYKLPDVFVKNMITKRSEAIRKGLPDAIDLLVICAESGLTVDAAFARVSRELGKGYPELGDEFSLTSIELGFLTERRKAFENLAQRVALESVRGIVTTMIQTEKYGTPLASALRVLSAEFRNERMMRAEEKAARLPAIMTVPLMIFILPVIFIVIIGPAACQVNDNFMNR